MKIVVKHAYWSVWASRKSLAKIWSREVEEYKRDLENQGEVVNIQPIASRYCRIKFWIFTIKEK